MSKRALAFIAGLTLTLGFSSPALPSDIVGTVVGANGSPLQGAQVIVKAQNSTTTGAAITNQQGQYEIQGLSSGVYLITLDPKASNIPGQTVVSNLNDDGLTVNWAASPGRQPIATAQPGIHQALASPTDMSAASTYNNGNDNSQGNGSGNDNCQGNENGEHCKPSYKH
jgi:hypothetical protein